MLRLVCHAEKEITVKPEHFHAAIMSMLPEVYHNKGYVTINYRKVKAHSIGIPNRRKIQAGEPFFVDVKGLDLVVDHVRNYLRLQPYYYLADIMVNVINVVEYQPLLTERFRTLSPILLRIQDKNPYFKYTGVNNRRQIFFTPEENHAAWEAYAAKRLYNKARYLYEKVPEKPIIKIEDYQIRRPVLYNVPMKATMGIVTVFGDPFWQEFVFNFGIGDKTTYGLGNLIPVSV